MAVVRIAAGDLGAIITNKLNESFITLYEQSADIRAENVSFVASATVVASNAQEALEAIYTFCK